MAENESVLLQVRDIKKYFHVNNSLFSFDRSYVRAVDGISFDIHRSQTVGLVGESGCGKSTVGRLLLKLIEPTSGRIVYRNRNIFHFDRVFDKKFRENVQIIFQDPYSSLNPRKTILDIIGAPLIAHKKVKNKDELRGKVKELLQLVGLPEYYIENYPHEFSGGQRQRIGIARSIALNPRLIVCDEPVSALDVSIQSQIINLLQKLKEELRLSYLFISHDLSVVKYISDRILVMYLGKIVESGSSEELFAKPLHPYTRALISAVPQPDIANHSSRIILQGDLTPPPAGTAACRFAPRCYMAQKRCHTEEPEYREVAPGRFSACHYYDSV